MSVVAYDRLDDALEILGPYDALGNHGPMAAEALCALGRGGDVVGWMERYRKRVRFLKERAAPMHPIDGDRWRDSLGDFDRVEDWSKFFAGELKELPWGDVLDRWVLRLAPGFSAVALHGPIRTCHAVRAIAERDTPQRRKELADGLAHWAAGFSTLPLGPSARPRSLPSRAILDIEPLPADKRPEAASLMQAIKALDGFRPFESVAAEIDLSGSPDALLSDLTGTFAAAYLSNGSDFLSVFAFIHAVTGPAGLRMIAPYVSQNTLHEALRYAWQAAAAMYARFGGNPPDDDRVIERFDVENLIDRAVASDDEHAIKFTETCLREYALNPKAAYLAAAPHAVDYLSRNAR